MKMLVGVPVFRVSGLVRTCLQALTNSPAHVLAVDNAADEDVKAVLREFGDRIHILTNAENGYCNGGWNRIMEYGLNHDYDVIGLGSSDVALHPGWYQAVEKRITEHKKEVLIPNIGPPWSNPNTENVLIHPYIGWHFSFLPREAVQLVYPIPRQLRHWFGDNHMYKVLVQQNGWQHVLLNEVRCDHQQSAVTSRVPEAGSVVEQDKIEWGRLQ
jgi:hypothetical protein